MITHQIRELAEEMHQGQMYGEKPYMVHLDDVARMAEPYGTTAVAVAYWHDVMEDRPELRDIFIKKVNEINSPSLDLGQVIKMVELITDPQLTRAEAKRYMNKVFSGINVATDMSYVLLVKTIDRLCNVRASLNSDTRRMTMYIREHVDFRDAVKRLTESSPCIKATYHKEKNFCWTRWNDMWEELDGMLLYSKQRTSNLSGATALASARNGWTVVSDDPEELEMRISDEGFVSLLKSGKDSHSQQIKASDILSRTYRLLSPRHY